MLFFINWVQKQPSRLGKVVLKICSKFTGVHRCRSVISKVVKQLYWNHTSTRLVGWVQVNWKRFWLHLSQTGITNRPFTCTFTNFRFTQDKLALKPNPYFSLELALLCYKGFAHYYKQRLEYPHRQHLTLLKLDKVEKNKVSLQFHFSFIQVFLFSLFLIFNHYIVNGTFLFMCNFFSVFVTYIIFFNPFMTEADII